jgi:hypothetical protein
MRLFTIADNSSFNRRMPVVQTIVEGIVLNGRCRVCTRHRRYPKGDLVVRLGSDRAKSWPDLMACGDYPCFVLSERFLAALENFGISVPLGGELSIAEPVRNGLSLDDAPRYFWLDGNACRAATMDFEASGFVNVNFCVGCEAFEYDISKTYDRTHETPPPGHHLTYDESTGHHIFTANMGPTYFFCTEKIIDCVVAHKLLNVAITPLSRGGLGRPLSLGKKTW